MELEKVWIVWNIANTGLLTLVGLYTWMTSRDKASRDAIGTVEDAVIDVDKRVIHLEERVKHVPSDKDLGVLHKRITELSESQRTMQGELHHMNKTLGLIHEYLLNKGVRQ